MGLKKTLHSLDKCNWSAQHPNLAPRVLVGGEPGYEATQYP